MFKLNQVDSLTNFQKNAKYFVSKLSKTKTPLVLTVNGKAKLVIQDAEAYQVLVDQAEHSKLLEAIEAGMDDVKKGLSRSSEEVFADIETKYGF